MGSYVWPKSQSQSMSHEPQQAQQPEARAWDLHSAVAMTTLLLVCGMRWCPLGIELLMMERKWSQNF